MSDEPSSGRPAPATPRRSISLSTVTFDRRANSDGVEQTDDGEGRMPRRPHRRFLTRWSALLLAAMTCAIGFYVGVRVEKRHIASSPTTIAGGGGFAARSGAAAAGGAATGGSASGADATKATGGSTAGALGAGGAAGLAGRFAGGNATFGTIASIDGTTLTLTEAGGDTVKVKLTSATKITKAESAKRRQIHPGDTITVSGLTGKRGAVSAATVADSGATTTGGSSSSGGSSGSGSSGGSAVSSLFSGG